MVLVLSMANINISPSVSRARARARAKKLITVPEKTPEESDDAIRLPGFNGVFTPAGPSFFRPFSHFPAPTDVHFLPLSAQNGESLRPSPRAQPNSETGE